MSDKPPPAVIAVLALFVLGGIFLYLDRSYWHVMPKPPCPKIWVTDDAACLRECMLATYSAEQQFQARQDCLREICNSKQVCKP